MDSFSQIDSPKDSPSQQCAVATCYTPISPTAPSTLSDYSRVQCPYTELDAMQASDASGVRKFATLLGEQAKALTPFLLMMLYSVLGAWIFVVLEKDNDAVERQMQRIQVREARRILHDSMYNASLSENWQNAENRSAMIMTAIENYETGINFRIAGEETIWNFYNSLLYAGTIYTTIGYGNIACKTTAGRIATIFYAIVGIPLTLTVLNQLGNVLLRLMTKTTQLFQCCCCKRKKSRRAKVSLEKDVEKGPLACETEGEYSQGEGDTGGGFKSEHENDPPLIITLISTIGWLFICAGIFCLWEDWDYFTSFYFFFISLSTIGFGDIVPDYPQYMIMNVGLVFIGLALVSVTVNVVQQKLEDVYMSILTKLLNDYLTGLSDSKDGVGANVGMIRSWAMNKKAKYLIPLLSKSQRKLVMQRFQDEAKAQGIQLPPTLTNLNPGTGLPNILTIDRQPSVVQHVIQEKEQESSPRPRPSRLSLFSSFIPSPSSPTVQSIHPVSPSPRLVHASCQTTRSPSIGPNHPVGWQLRETSSQTDVIGASAVPRAQDTLPLTRTASDRLAPGWRLREAASQTHVGSRPGQCTGSQTDLPRTTEKSLQHGAGFGSLATTGSQTRLERGNAGTQTRITSMRDLQEDESQTSFEQVDGRRLTRIAAAREAETQTSSEEEACSKTLARNIETNGQCAQLIRESAFELDAREHTMRELRERPFQTVIDTQEARIQTWESQVQTLRPDALSVIIQTPMSCFEMRHCSSQTIRQVTSESLRSLARFDDVGSQIKPETCDIRAQAGQPFFLLQNVGSQTKLTVAERHALTWPAGEPQGDAVVVASVARFRTAEEPYSERKECDVQTKNNASEIGDQSIASMPPSHAIVRSVGVQTDDETQSRMKVSMSQQTASQHVSASSPSSRNRQLFRQMSLQKIAVRQRTATSPGNVSEESEEIIAVSRSLRKVPLPLKERSAETRERVSTLETDHLPSVNTLVSQFERRRVSQPHVMDVPSHFPYLRRKRSRNSPVAENEWREEAEEMTDSSHSSD